MDVDDYTSLDAIRAQELDLDTKELLDTVAIVFPHSDEVYEM